GRQHEVPRRAAHGRARADFQGRLAPAPGLVALEGREGREDRVARLDEEVLAMPTTITQEPVLGSFHIEQEVEIAVPRERLWECLADVGGWWLYCEKGKAVDVVLEPRVGGRFFQRF